MRKLLMSAFGLLTMTAMVRTASAQGACTQIARPDMAMYTTRSNRCSLGAIGSTTSTCTTGATFGTPLSVRGIGMGWATWSPIGESELGSATIVGFNGGASTLTINLASPAAVTGFELEPNQFAPATISASFQTSDGTEVLNVTREVIGDSGARLFAADCPCGLVSKIVITAPPAAGGFAIGTLRSDGFPAGADEDLVPGGASEIPEGLTSNALP